MAKAIVTKSYPGWRVGDHIEVFGERINELAGYIKIIEPDPIKEEKTEFEKTVEEIVPKVKKGRPKKGVS